MGKKVSKSSGKVSAGINSNVDKKILNGLRREYLQSGDRIMNQLRAFRNKKNVMLTIENPNKEDKGRKYIRVPASAVWKQPER